MSDRHPIKVTTVKHMIYAPGTQPDFPEGLYAEELVFDGWAAGDPSRIEVVWDPLTKTIRLFAKSE